LESYITKASSGQDGSTMMHFLDVDAEIERDSECEGLSWGRDEGSVDTLVMLICKSTKINKSSSMLTLPSFRSALRPA
jgi:hypothetical protein